MLFIPEFESLTSETRDARVKYIPRGGRGVQHQPRGFLINSFATDGFEALAATRART